MVNKCAKNGYILPFISDGFDLFNKYIPQGYSKFRFNLGLWFLTPLSSIGSCKSNNHTTTTAPILFNKRHKTLTVFEITYVPTP
jgi:hypothetical protein